MKKKVIMVLLATLTFGLQAFSQNMVKGIVIDSKGEAIPGASVLVQGTSTSAITDVNGTFHLTDVNARSVLVISCLGYESANVTVGNQETVKCILTDDSETLEDIVAVAYGAVRKSDLTGAIGTVDGKAVSSQAVSSVTRALDGLVPGLQTVVADGQPGIDIAMRIRGIGTAEANNAEPLIVVDGVPAIVGTNPLSSINSRDIESVTVLKDAASAAIYGARAANGVVLVTTKTGKSGKTKVSFETKLGFNTMGPKGKFNKIGDDNVAELYEFYWESIYNDIYYGKSAVAGDMAGNSTAAANYASAHLFDYVAKESFEMNGLGNNMAYEVPGAIYTITGKQGTANQSATMSGAYLVNTDGKINPEARLIWGDSDIYDALMSNSLRQEYNISVSGATDKVDYHMSVGYLSDPSYIASSGFDRLTARANVNAQVTNWLKAGANVAYTNRETRSQPTRWGRNPGYVTQNAFTWTGVSTSLDHMYALDENGDFILNDEGGKMINCVFGRNYPNVANSYSPLGNTYTKWNYNMPLFYEQAENSQKYDDFTMKGYLRASFLKHFSVEANIAYDKTLGNLTRFWNAQSAHSMNGLSDSYGSAIHRTRAEYSVLNSQILANYAQNFGNHHVEAILGHEYYQYDYSNMYVNGAHTLTNDSQAYVNYLGTAGYSTFGSGSGGGFDKETLESYFAGADYNYDRRFYFSGTIRRDGTSRIRYNDKRWGTFWSIGAGWRITNETWMQGTGDWLDNLKIRASYGVLGNLNGIDRYSGYQRWSYGGSNWTSGAATYPQSYTLSKSAWVNDGLTYERVNTANAGFDFILLGGKIAGTFDMFSRHNRNVAWSNSVSYLAAGHTTVKQNVAGIRSAGIEFDLSYQPVKSKDWDVIVSINGTHYNTRLTSIPEGKEYCFEVGPDAWTMAGVGALNYTAYYRGVGKDYYNLYTYKYGGVAGNTGVRYYGTDNAWHTGYTKGDKDAGHALFYHKVTDDEASLYGVPAGSDILTPDASKATRYEIGDALPELYGGFAASMRYKSLDFSMNFTYQIGGKYIDNNYCSTECGLYMTGVNLSGGNQAISSELLGNTWSENNLDAKYPMNYYSADQTASGAAVKTGGYAPTDMSVFNASYLSFKNITIGYTLPDRLTEKVGISNLRVYASADNPILITGHSGYDPRRSMTGALEVGSFSYTYIAAYTFGINIDF